ncbi:MAG: hypothetical protein DWQ19_12695 [Crenarchaeota archaeon]|nr:MAG: hypothetical protein DWQ19_12695 [Thermoproteota archaeon]
MELNFKVFLEMPHLAIKRHGRPAPFFFEDGYVKFIDMKFEDYPPGAPERKLNFYNSQFYGKLPGQNAYLILDDPKNFYVGEQEPGGSHFKLRDDWYDYAVFLFMDGSIKEPRNVREDEPNVRKV